MSQNKNLIREKNMRAIKQMMREKGTAYKAEIAAETGLSVVTVNALVAQLVEAKVLIEGDLMPQTVGRPAIAYHFNEEQQYFLLLSIQEKLTPNYRQLMIHGQIVNLAGDIKYTQTTEFSEVTMPFFLACVQPFLSAGFEIAKIGVSIPGKIYQGVILSSWENLLNQWHLQDALSAFASVPVVIQNDAHLVTIGYTVREKRSKEETIVGIFYPENSMPGITIYAKGTLIEGNMNLAGEAKFLPHLMEEIFPLTNEKLIGNLVEIFTIYNAVIAPNNFVISADSVTETAIRNKIAQSTLLAMQVNQPQFLFVDQFTACLYTGLLWLVLKDSDYAL